MDICSIKKEETKVRTITLTNKNGMSVELINFGARIKSIKFPVNGKPTEMILGYKTTKDYLSDEFYLGATCGRVCNRVSKGQFQLNGELYQLPLNDGDNCLHGGVDNFSFRYWNIDELTPDNSSVTFSLISPNGDQGFPGTLNISVTYQLSDDNKLSIEYKANTDLSTVVNVTNHTYFNLGEEDCLSLQLKLKSQSFLEIDKYNIPTGEILSVENTDYDFLRSGDIGGRLKNTEDKSLKQKNGYDHCFILDKSDLEQPKAVLSALNNKVKLCVYTDQLAIQLYTGFYLSGEFKPYEGLCLEAQNYTDADNHKHFPSNELTPNKVYHKTIVFGFETIK